MTEKQWQHSSDVEAMLTFLENIDTTRKFRLFACACCRRIWHLLSVDVAKTALEVSECYADGKASLEELARAASDAICHVDSCYVGNRPDGGAYAAYVASSPYERDDNSFADTACLGVFNAVAALGAANQISPDRPAQSAILRDIFGNPFRPVAVDPVWLTWRDGTIPQLAQTIYEERRFADMPVLADVLEEAGCRDADLLQHCRQPGEHVRGCWVVDLLLGKA